MNFSEKGFEFNEKNLIHQKENDKKLVCKCCDHTCTDVELHMNTTCKVVV